MSTAMDERLVKARQQVQELHQKIDAARSKGQEAMRAEFATISTRAGELSASLKEFAAQDRAGTQKGVADASAALREAAEHARTAASEQQAKAKAAAEATLSKAHAAVKKLSENIATRRAAAKDQKTPAKV